MNNRLEDICVWWPAGHKEGEFDGVVAKADEMSMTLFHCGKPIDQAYLEWKEKKGIKAALEAQSHSEDEYEYVRTAEWFKNDCKKSIIFEWGIEGPSNIDILRIFGASSPVVSNHVVDILADMCPEEFEAFPVEFSNIISQKSYYLLNLTNVIPEKDALQNGLGKLSIARLCKRKSFYDDTGDILYSGHLARALDANNITGLLYPKYSEHPFGI